MDLKLKIQNLLDPYDSSQTECDGMTRICHTILTQHHIEHQIRMGTLTFHGQNIEPHLWIDLSSEYRVDYRARMWLNDNKDAPHGVFNSLDFPDFIYQGELIELELLSPELLTIMTLQFDTEKFIAKQ